MHNQTMHTTPSLGVSGSGTTPSLRRFNSNASTSSSINNINMGSAVASGVPDPITRITPSEEIVFQRMAYRKLERQLRGTYKNDKPWTVLWTFLTLLLLFGLVAPNFVDYKDEDNNPQPHKRSFDIQVNIRDLGFLSLMAVITVVMLVYTLTRVVVVVRWSLYWLLATLSILYLWKRQINLFSSDTPLVLLVGFGILEFVTFFVYILMNFLYPPFIKSQFFRRNIGVTWWFGIKPQSRQHWTLTYLPSSWFEGRRTCTYRGETDADGLPHGFGNWLDDSFHGELLSGMWERGDPVGPFRSREFGSGFAFESLRIGYVHCSDDSFVSRNFFPSQTKLPTIGVASVECSVAGGFFSHLPRAVIREGPYCMTSVLDAPDDDIETQMATSVSSNPYFGTSPHYPFRRVTDVLPHIKVLYTEHPSSSLIITATRGRGVLVSGHTFVTGSESHAPDQLVIDVVRPAAAAAAAAVESRAQQSNGLPSAPPLPVAPARHLDRFDTEESLSTSLQQTDALRSSLYLASDEDDEEGDGSTDSLMVQASATKSTRRRSQGNEDEDDGFHTPFLQYVEADASTTTVTSQQLQKATREEEDEEENEDLYFNLAHIPAATFHNQLLQQQNHLLHRPHSNVFQGSRILVSQPRFEGSTLGVGSTLGASSTVPGGQTFLPGPHLRVRDWKSTVDGHVEALIFFPGFNASLEHSLQRLGQFMAMGRFPPHIKPMVFSWPCAREATYLWATESANSKQTHHALAALLRGLESAGVKDIHFLVHSLGAQVVCSALREEEDDTGDGMRKRSMVSKLFSSMSSAGEQDLGGRLRLRTVTLLNPDTPLSNFIHKDFKGMRRVCDHITVVGDRKDGALDWSELGNGFMKTLQELKRLFCSPSVPSKTTYAQDRDEEDDDDEPRPPSRVWCGGRHSLCPCRRPFALCCRGCVDGCCRPYRHGVDRMFSRVLTVGKNIFSLYVRSDDEHQPPLLQRSFAAAFSRQKDVGGRTIDDEVSFELLGENGRATSAAGGDGDAGGEDGTTPKRRRNRKWLDVDVIDTSSMETNVHQLRHAYFDLNKILVEDLHELIVTGKRAAERSLLLHREGNIFSFCQAPACVVNQ